MDKNFDGIIIENIFTFSAQNLYTVLYSMFQK